MTSRERVKETIKHKIPDKIPKGELEYFWGSNLHFSFKKKCKFKNRVEKSYIYRKYLVKPVMLRQYIGDST